ncbi:hypothetical protein HYU92_04455 [Candidatus Curtissbacteria bacterium]|nr:hypothetical protein [Candidatus Curtissbacteria bacterium]
MKKQLSEQEILMKNWEKYRGSIVMVIGDKIFSTKSAKNVASIVNKIEKKFHRRPLITYVPKEQTLVLLI